MQSAALLARGPALSEQARRRNAAGRLAFPWPDTCNRTSARLVLTVAAPQTAPTGDDDPTVDDRERSSPPPPPPSAFGPWALARILARLCRIVGLTLLCVPPMALLAFFHSARSPGLLRWYFQTSGGLFVKLGQILALRYDLLPDRYCRELSKLLDALPPVSTRAITKEIERALGKPVGELFLTFQEAPLSCASVAQVHAATLHTGESVVVKVVRPGVDASFRADLLFVGVCAAWVEYLGFGSSLGLRRLARELAV